MSKIIAPKDKGFLYDASSVHWPYAKELGFNYEDATYHFIYLLRWAAEHKYLTPQAESILSLESLPKNFELRSWMFTKEFNEKVPKVYDKWVKKSKYGNKKMDMTILEKALSE